MRQVGKLEYLREPLRRDDKQTLSGKANRKNAGTVSKDHYGLEQVARKKKLTHRQEKSLSPNLAATRYFGLHKRTSCATGARFPIPRSR